MIGWRIACLSAVYLGWCCCKPYHAPFRGTSDMLVWRFSDSFITRVGPIARRIPCTENAFFLKWGNPERERMRNATYDIAWDVEKNSVSPKTIKCTPPPFLVTYSHNHKWWNNNAFGIELPCMIHISILVRMSQVLFWSNSVLIAFKTMLYLEKDNGLIVQDNHVQEQEV